MSEVFIYIFADRRRKSLRFETFGPFVLWTNVNNGGSQFHAQVELDHIRSLLVIIQNYPALLESIARACKVYLLPEIIQYCT